MANLAFTDDLADKANPIAGDKLLLADSQNGLNIANVDVINLPISTDTQAALDLKLNITDLPTIPTLTSELTNDSGFITAGDIPPIPANTSDLINDSLVASVVAGTNVTIDNTDPRNPIVNSTGGGGGIGTLQEVTDLGATTNNTIEISITDDQHGLEVVNSGGLSQILLEMIGNGGAVNIIDSLGNLSISMYEGEVSSNQFNGGAFYGDTFNGGTLSGNNSGDNATNSQYSGLATEIAGKQFFHGVEGNVLAAFPTHTTTTTITFTGSTTNIPYWNNGVRTLVTTNITTTLSGAAGLYFIYFDNTGTLVNSTTFPGLNGTNVIFASCLWNGTNYGLIQYEAHSYDRNIDWHTWAHTTVGCRYVSGITFTPTGTGATSSFTSTAGEIADEDIRFTFNASSAFPTANTIRSLYQTGATTYGFDATTTTQPYKLGTANRPGYIDSVTYAYTTLPSATNRYVNFFIYGATDNHTPLYSVAETAVAGTILNGYTSTANARAVPFPNLSGFGLSAEMKPLYRMVVRADGLIQAITAADDYRTVSSLPQAAGTTSTTASAVTYTPSGDLTATTVQTALDEVATGKYQLMCTSQTAVSSTPYTFTGTEARNGGYLVDTSAGDITINLDADLFTTGYEVNICKGTGDVNWVSIDSGTGNNINGTQVYSLTRQYEVVTLLKDGANTWKIKSKYEGPSFLNSKADLASPTFTGTVTTPAIKITGGTPGAGKVLTSDADGDATWETAAGGGQQFTTGQDGQIVVGQLEYFVCTKTQTIAGVYASLSSLPTGANVTIQVYKNGTASTNSIFTSDTALTIATNTGATNGQYSVLDTAIDNGSVVAGDVLYVFVTQVGSSLPGSDLFVAIY